MARRGERGRRESIKPIWRRTTISTRYAINVLYYSIISSGKMREGIEIGKRFTVVCFMPCLPETVSEFERGDPPFLPLFLSFRLFQKISLAPQRLVRRFGTHLFARWHRSIPPLCAVVFASQTAMSDVCVEEGGREKMRDDEVRGNGCGGKDLLRINCERTRKWGK